MINRFVLGAVLMIEAASLWGALGARAQVIPNPTTSFQGCVDRTVTPWVIGYARKDGTCVAEMTQDPAAGALSIVPGVAVPGANGGTVTSITAGAGLAGARSRRAVRCRCSTGTPRTRPRRATTAAS